MNLLSLFEAVFIDPLTSRFAFFYIPGLILLIGIAVAFRRPPRPAALKPQPRAGRSLSSRVVRFGNALADRIAASDITPNQVSWLGLALVACNSVLYLYHRNSFWLGMGLALSYLFDALDGLVARRQGSVSKFGGYLDAVIDRYQEIATCLVLSVVTGWWLVIFFIITGSMLTSYSKARVAIEMPVDNKGWPDLLVRHRRLWLLSFALLGDACVPWLLYFVLISLAAMSYFTAVQRYFRARSMLSRLDREAKSQA
jgi:phosphatidylglycerophosphate synthase